MHLKVALSFSLLAALFLTGCNSNTVIESTPEEIDPQHVANEWMTAHYAEVQQWGAQVPMSDSVAIGMVEAFYANHEYNTVWTTAGEPNQQAVEVTNLMAQAVNYGLDSSYYDLAALRALYQEVNTLEAEAGMEAMARYEWKLTHESLVFMSHLNQGVLERDSLWFEPKLDQVTKDLVALLDEGHASGDMSTAVLAAQPDFYEYHRLQKGLTAFLENYTLNTDTIYVSNPKSDSAKVNRQAREALLANGFLADSLKDDNTAYVEALKTYQTFCGLEADGKVGKNSRRALMVNNHTRYLRAVASLQRLRWESDSSDDYVLVNIPEYKMKVVEENAPQHEFRVVVGSKWTPTPTLTSRMTHFVMNPNWYVPYSISTREIMPKAQADSSYLARNGYKVYEGRTLVGTDNIDWSKVRAGTYKVRQSSGRGNALGKVKFLFHNDHSVYLHDTNQKRFFKKDVRAYSHGCMRLENPMDFADYLVQRDQHVVAPDSLDSIYVRGNRQNVNLAEPLDIKVRYVSCVGKEDGSGIIFYEDVYELDVPMVEALNNSTSALRKTRQGVSYPL